MNKYNVPPGTHHPRFNNPQLMINSSIIPTNPPPPPLIMWKKITDITLFHLQAFHCICIYPYLYVCLCVCI